MDFRREMLLLIQGEATGTFNWTTERQSRELLNEKYRSLRSLLPNPTKTDRASVVGDAINYIKEMRRAIDHLKVLVEKKRRGMTSCKRLKTEEEEPVIDMESSSIKPVPFNGSSKSSWLLRKSKEAIVDVCIIDNEINIKLIQRKKGNCFLLVARVLDELQLELLQVTGGKVGEYCVFNFKSKTGEGSSVSTGETARRINGLLDGQFPTFCRL